MYPVFSVIAPVYGVEDYIEEFADSLLGQSYDAVQFIFVNDGTKDSSIRRLERLVEDRYAALKDRIVIVNKVNEGLPAARKSGMSYASGDYVLHVDSDDWLETDLLEHLAGKIRETEADIVYFDFYKEYSNHVKHDVEKEYTADTKMRYIRRMFNDRAYGYVWNKCVKRSLYTENDIHFSPYGMHEDIYLTSQLIYNARSLTHLKLPLYHYRRNNPGSISTSSRIRRRRDSAMNMMDLYEHFMDNVEASPVRDVLGSIFYRTAWLSLRYGFGFFDKYPYLAPMLRKINPSFGNKTFILCQLLVKIYVHLRRL